MKHKYYFFAIHSAGCVTQRSIECVSVNPMNRVVSQQTVGLSLHLISIAPKTRFAKQLTRLAGKNESIIDDDCNCLVSCILVIWGIWPKQFPIAFFARERNYSTRRVPGLRSRGGSELHLYRLL